MNCNQLIVALALAAAATSSFSQEATPDTWQNVVSTKPVEQVRAELARARADGTIKAWSAGYMEKIASGKSREQLRAEVAAARRSGELQSINSEAYAFAPVAGKGIRFVRYN